MEWILRWLKEKKEKWFIHGGKFTEVVNFECRGKELIAQSKNGFSQKQETT